MTSQFGFLPLLAGLAALATGLYFLQRLRVRQQPLVVETTLFWSQALEETRARVFVQRFRHPWVYAFLLAIAALIWFGAAELRSLDSEHRQQLILLDGSAHMIPGQRFATAVDDLEAYLDRQSEAQRCVQLCGAQIETLLLPNENNQLLRERLKGVSPQACPSSLEMAIRDFLATNPDPTEWSICLVGAPALKRDFVATLPTDLKLVHLEVSGDEQGSAHAGNVGIINCGTAPAMSGNWGQVDVLVEVSSQSTQANFSLAGQAWSGVIEKGANGAEAGQRFILRDLPANGEVFEAQLVLDSADSGGADSLAADNHARLRLPDYRPIPILIDEGLPPALSRALAQDPGLVVTASAADAQLVVRNLNSALGMHLPALVVSNAAAQANGILLIHEEGEDSNEVLVQLHEDLGLAEIDASDLSAGQGGEARISMGASPGPKRALKIWRRLLGDDYNFVRSRSFPVFVALGLRWLAGHKELPPNLAVGERSTLTPLFATLESGPKLAFLGAEFRPQQVGEYQLDSGDMVSASLLDPDLSLADRGVLTEIESVSNDSASLSLFSLFILLAITLLFADWFLFLRGRIP